MITFAIRILNQLALGTASKNTIQFIGGKPSYTVSFRCWPIDMDTNFHMNNACYMRVGELSRWRLFPEAKMYSFVAKYGVMFLVKEQTVKYYKAISPFQKYIVRTSISVSDDKWLDYNHQFEQHPSTVKAGEAPIIYTDIQCRAVLKERTGKTVPISTFVDQCELYKALMPSTQNSKEENSK